MICWYVCLSFELDLEGSPSCIAVRNTLGPVLLHQVLLNVLEFWVGDGCRQKGAVFCMQIC